MGVTVFFATKMGVTVFFALFLAFWAVLDTINYVMLKLLLAFTNQN